jgi:hypothetical protein
MAQIRARGGGGGGGGVSNHLIDHLLRDVFACSSYQGVYSANSIPQEQLLRREEPFAIVVNLSRREERGTHFVTIIKISQRVCVYLDPLALNATLYAHIGTFLRRLNDGGSDLLALDRPIQARSSNLCGLYCVQFVLMFDAARYASLAARLCRPFRTAPRLRGSNDGVLWRNICALAAAAAATTTATTPVNY